MNPGNVFWVDRGTGRIGLESGELVLVSSLIKFAALVRSIVDCVAGLVGDRRTRTLRR